MKSIACLICFFCFLCSFTGSLQAQEDRGEFPWSVNEATTVGAGGYNLLDTYLSPGQKMKYAGWGLRVMNERMKMVPLSDYRVSRQQFISVDMAFTDNGAGTASDFAGFIDYTLGYHYHFPLLPGLKLLAGGAAHGMTGFIYNTRNGNNPASAKADIDLNFSGMLIYGLKIKNYPLTFRYQLTIPFAGVFFSPHYGQSYYEIFDLGNSSGVVQFNSFHNKFAMKHYGTVDFPVGNLTIRAGYLNSSYRTDVNGIQSHIVSHSFMIGFVKEFISFGGKRLKNKGKYSSAYY